MRHHRFNLVRRRCASPWQLTQKTTGIIGAVRSGMINALITDIHTAQAILDRLVTNAQ